MKCENCQTELEPGSTHCPRCGQPCPSDYTDPNRSKVLDAELVDENSPPRRVFSQQSQSGQDGYRQVIYTNFSGPVSGSSGCLPVIVTLVLAFAAAVCYGFLAGLGFLFFSAIGFGLTFFVSIQRIFNGKNPNLIVAGIVTWVLSWLLVAWMSGAFSK